MRNYIKDILYGIATGDALGVPVEFLSRGEIALRPITGMQGYGTHNQPPGTWSDDSSLTFCLAEMLCGEYDLTNLANRFINWRNYGYWTPRGEVFDIGIATSHAINRLQDGISPVLAGGDGEWSNGNGSLMRILPLLFYIKDLSVADRFNIIGEVSSLTHRHSRSIVACFLYLEMALNILQGKDKQTAYTEMCKTANDFLADEKEAFSRVLSGDIPGLHINDIKSTGYVVHTLEAAIWCLLKTNDYQSAVLSAVNLGDDTDTTAAVTGGIAGLLYGWETIPAEWLNLLAKKTSIDKLIINLQAKIDV
ncbi:ADP-ribosylglycohydrolase family protein [Chitinophaga oryziterrae]|uniref:ADP-ribosylglycohydrolase family protein n=1 Tax=Chitinophaga oryziterrae TaxID=1031224 RepID=A0A6N8JHB1_9BACT|nr:ADP-ribosylglycohydrolase family protein [Chitinophaga oryziterrae]MVT44695.1 ADP-ribosylglycohydrolase family protein [Chitinophaga oryziterrae]